MMTEKCVCYFYFQNSHCSESRASAGTSLLIRLTFDIIIMNLGHRRMMMMCSVMLIKSTLRLASTDEEATFKSVMRATNDTVR
jgi:hypothetical protein